MELNDLEINILALKWMQEDYGQLVDVALDKILEVIEELKESNPELALKLSEVYAQEDFWERTKKYAYEGYLETLNE